MHIDFVRTGGFAGTRLAASLDTQQLPADQASRIEKMVTDAGFFSLSPTIRPSTPMPDRFEYQISILTAGKSHLVVVGESVVLGKMRPLLDYLTALALVKKDQ